MGLNIIKLARKYNRKYALYFAKRYECCDNIPKDAGLVSEAYTAVTTLTINHQLGVRNEFTFYDNATPANEFVPAWTDDGNTAIITFGIATTGTVTYFVNH